MHFIFIKNKDVFMIKWGKEMKSKFLFSAFLVLCYMAQSQVFPVETIVDNGLPTKRVKFVFLSDGYTAAQLPEFITSVTNFKNNLFTQPPFSNYQNFFNIYAIKVPSVESGADHPGNANDIVENLVFHPVLVANTYFNTTFDYGGIHRLVVPQNGIALNNVLADNFPTFNQGFIFANSPFYGGSGGFYATSTVEARSDEVSIHEIGHSFGGLADEYTIGGQGERPNRTLVTDPLTIKWKNWIGSENIGVFPIGIEGWQRPHQNCKMQFLDVPFCAVCKEAFVNKIYSIVTPIYSYLPSSTTPTVNATTNFSANLTLPIPNTLSTDWILNGTSIATGVDNVNIDPAILPAGNSTLTLFVTDNTLLSRTFLPAKGYVFSQTWTITKGALPLEWLNFEAKREQNNGVLTWQTAQEQDVSHFEVQKSFDGKNFQAIGEVKAHNSLTKAEYRFIDNNLIRGATYYRLQQYDKDRKSTFSPIRTLEKSDKFYYKISPNPVKDVLNISGNTDYNTEVKIELYNEAGSKLYDYLLKNVENEYQHTVSISHLPNGIYVVVLNLPNGFSIKEKILKVN
jgi:IgA Peptidase M64/Secretion system C-terminal sorting domain